MGSSVSWQINRAMHSGGTGGRAISAKTPPSGEENVGNIRGGKRRSYDSPERRRH